ncbi:PREDICTED: uncharacterized protein LOC108377048 [Rhagoletis zephyria]|uniref:uncharacterized protein LOC108377048 n=1 Tax=Rhagoletis zephyria TaxID=28612 RepID=UPI00081147C4|nr:PREDICTED: uncharacterized protein LOC108377048 [Rhagoletis zephyria]
MKFYHVLTINLFLIACRGLVSDATIEEEDCENEEKEVEVCATDFLIYRNGSLPQSGPELDKFCRESKSNEGCLRAHSKKCLSHSANQAITELIRSMSKQNRVICSNKNNRRLYGKTTQCINKHPTPNVCYQKFVDDVHGIHQFGQEEKIPVICCSYVAFSSCLQEQVKSCGTDSVNAVNRLVQNYAGETLNYVCREYKGANKCSSSNKPAVDLSQINEEVPKSFFSLLVKIYLS